MGFWEVRDTRNTKTYNTINIADLFTKTTVTENNVLNIPAVSSSVDLISSIVSMLDIRLYKRIRCDKVEEVEQDYRLKLLNLEPNYLMNSTQLKKSIVQDVLLHGASYVNIDKQRNKFKNLYYVEHCNVSVQEDVNPIKKTAKINVLADEFEVYDFVIPTLNTKNGVTGQGILTRNKELLQLALLEQKYVNSLYANGGTKRGFFTTDKRLNGESFDEFKNAIKQIYKEDMPDMILNNGAQYNTLSNTNVEMQVLESRRFINEEIRSVFNIPQVLDAEGYKTFIKVVLTPILNAIEGAINKSLLLEKEKTEGYYFKFDLVELTRANIKERFEAYKLALDSGIKTINEVRADENLESIEGLDITKFSLANVIYDIKSKEYFTPNTKQITNVGGDKVEEVETMETETTTELETIEEQNKEV